MAENLHLPLEYEGMYRGAGGDFGFANGVYDADALRPGRVLGLGFFEKIDDVPFVQLGIRLDDKPNAPVVRVD